ncbi:hypothetical protein [uncultured Shewanella sp.]|uniref:hypothetical protein n=1 Tax=uncultured Shewanella sp. TaxID=173975 RepID=UPI00260E43C2|nr:hypothetical protein [uncultured Shewanella sp.]
MEDTKSSRIIEIICPNKLRPTPTGIKFNHFNDHGKVTLPKDCQFNRFICPLCREQHDWTINDVVDF